MARRERGSQGPTGAGDSDPAALPAALAALSDLADLLGGESTRSRRFLGGLVFGALVGASLAGTSFLRRMRPGR
jgi:hypothetical protein